MVRRNGSWDLAVSVQKNRGEEAAREWDNGGELLQTRHPKMAELKRVKKFTRRVC